MLPSSLYAYTIISMTVNLYFDVPESADSGACNTKLFTTVTYDFCLGMLALFELILNMLDRFTALPTNIRLGSNYYCL
jgi:hypothetical protein